MFETTNQTWRKINIWLMLEPCSATPLGLAAEFTDFLPPAIAWHRPEKTRENS
jgi:hypothetical protein